MVAVKPYGSGFSEALVRLRQDSVDVFEAEDDAQAFEALQKASGCVLLIYMNVQDDLRRFLEWIRKLKAPLQQKRVRIVKVSTLGVHPVMEAMDTAGFSETIKDPVNEKSLHFKLDRHFRTVVQSVGQGASEIGKLLAPAPSPFEQKIASPPVEISPRGAALAPVLAPSAPVTVLAPARATPGAPMEPSLSSLAFGFLISEILSQPERSSAELAERACGYLSSACQGARVELWMRAGSWIHAGSAIKGKGTPNPARHEKDVQGFERDVEGTRQGFSPIPSVVLAPVLHPKTGKILGAVVISTEEPALAPSLDFIRGCSFFFVGILLGEAKAVAPNLQP